MTDTGAVPDPGGQQAVPLTYGIAANIKQCVSVGPGGAETERGTKHFAPGAKVWLLPQLWGMPDERYIVVGRHRGSSRYIEIAMPVRHLENLRVRGVYSPALCVVMQRPFGKRRIAAKLWDDVERAERFAGFYNAS